MGDFFKRNRLRFLLCILALLIGVLLYAAMQGGQTTGVMGVVLNPLRQVTQTVSKQAERPCNGSIRCDRRRPDYRRYGI